MTSGDATLGEPLPCGHIYIRGPHSHPTRPYSTPVSSLVHFFVVLSIVFCILGRYSIEVNNKLCTLDVSVVVQPAAVLLLIGAPRFCASNWRVVRLVCTLLYCSRLKTRSLNKCTTHTNTHTTYGVCYWLYSIFTYSCRWECHHHGSAYHLMWLGK
jgi:hypothetical protein